MKVILFSILIISMMFIVFSPQVEAQWIITEDEDGPQTEFFDLRPIACVLPETVFISGGGFTPNALVDIYTTDWPENLNRNDMYLSPPLPGTPVISLQLMSYFTTPTTITTNANGDFSDIAILVQPPIGLWNFIAHEQDGTNNWNAATDAIDIVNYNGFSVESCIIVEYPLGSIDAAVKERMAASLIASNFAFGTKTALVFSAAFPNVYVGPAGGGPAADSLGVYVMYPDGSGELSANGEYQIITSSDFDTNFGYSMATGDFNHDGLGDLAIGVPGADKNNKEDVGRVDVYYGDKDTERLIYGETFYYGLNGIVGDPKKNDNFGWSLAAGDFNSDGYDDLAIGVPNSTVSDQAKAGRVVIIYGTAADDGLDSSTSEKWSQNASGIHGTSQEDDRFGYSLTTGDFDGNQYDDLVIGVPYEGVGKQSSAGAVNVIYGGMGSDGKLSSKNNQLWHQNSDGILGTSEKNDRFGWSLTTGNYDGIGKDDLAIGVAYEGIGSTPRAGAVNVIYGSYGTGGKLSSFNNQIWYQGETERIEGFLDKDDNFGYSLASGDFNDDGYEDLAIGVPYEMINNISDAGAVNIIYGSNMQLSYIGDQLWSQDVAGMSGTSESKDHFGWSIFAADFDSDGIDDLAVGIPDKNILSLSDVGAISMIYGMEGDVLDGMGLNAFDNQYWYPGSSVGYIGD